ncbi:MAG: FAD-dependent oxidoreductase [Desulfosarcinaceae bacterium]
MPKTYEHILIIGGGVGGALAHDLTQRGFRVTLVERGELLSGASGRHHGLLHSGARYALHDIETAAECYRENQILRRIAPQAIEPNGGLFVAVEDRDLSFYEPFLDNCSQAGIPVRPLAPERALALEPALNPGLLAAVQVPDGVMDAFRLAMHFFAAASAAGADLRPFHEVVGLLQANERISGARVHDLRLDRRIDLEADLVVNAAGPWAGKIAALAGLDVPLQPGPGVMVSLRGRFCDRVINRLQTAGEGDIIVPQRRLSILGTTAWLADDPDKVSIPGGQVEKLVSLCAMLIPAVGTRPPHAVWCASRPLLQPATNQDPMMISRGFACVDHGTLDGKDGLITLLGGKATTMRAMAEQTADLICQKTGRNIACRTGQTVLPPYRTYWTQPHGI